MLYITQKARKIIDEYLQDLLYFTKDFKVGDLNYIITKILHAWIKNQGLKYKNLNAVIGLLECAKLEFYRMVVASYEETKIDENGNISELDKHVMFEESENKTCDHKWVERLDGIEDQCGAAICCLCGKYGCYHDANYREMNIDEKKMFHNNGINGNNHELEKRLKNENRI